MSNLDTIRQRAALLTKSDTFEPLAGEAAGWQVGRPPDEAERRRAADGGRLSSEGLRARQRK